MQKLSKCYEIEPNYRLNNSNIQIHFNHQIWDGTTKNMNCEFIDGTSFSNIDYIYVDININPHHINTYYFNLSNVEWIIVFPEEQTPVPDIV